MKIIDYKVIESGNNLDKFAQEVKELIKEGWEPIGGYSYYGGFHHQALVKTEKPNTLF